MVVKFVLKYAKTAAFVVGMLSVLGFAPYHYVWINFICFSFLLYLLLKADSNRQIFFIGYSFGFAHFACGFSWIGNALLIEAEKFGWLYPFVFIGSGGFFGLFVAGASVFIIKAKTIWQKWVMFAVGWVLFEWVRSFLFTGFPWNLLGYTLAFDDKLIQLASFGGTYFLSLIAILCFSIWGVVIYQYTYRCFVFAVIFTLACIATLWGFGYYRLLNTKMVEKSIVVRIVQPSISQKMKWNRQIAEDIFDKYIEMSSQPSESSPDIIVWGETASPFVLDADEKHLYEVAQILSSNQHLITGMISYQFNKGEYLPHNSMVVINSDSKIEAYYHKSHLVPFGEYIPLRQYLPNFIRPIANAIGEFGRGEGPKKIEIAGLPSFGGIICYEIIFPHQIVNPEERPDFLVNLTNDGWYGISSGPYQHWVTTKLRAVEEGITIIRAANNGVSGVINAYGQVKAMMPLNYTGVLDVRLDKSLKNTTLYSLLGNGVTLIFCLFLLFLGSIKIENR